MCVGSADI